MKKKKKLKGYLPDCLLTDLLMQTTHQLITLVHNTLYNSLGAYRVSRSTLMIRLRNIFFFFKSWLGRQKLLFIEKSIRIMFRRPQKTSYTYFELLSKTFKKRKWKHFHMFPKHFLNFFKISETSPQISGTLSS